ncbi:MAG: anthranilate synthase component I family protein [Myxococcales bacterium]|nr:anthranilate synthase component I family protein [Myxococcales bacterium]MCB9719125.1 anthranilate synthase component I family protein [Myxococcales bacterium]
MGAPSAGSGPEDYDLAASVLRGLAQGWLPGLSWLDGAEAGRSFVGAEPDLVIEGDDLRQLDDVEARWKADPSRVWVGWMTYELGVDRMLGRRPGRGPRPGLCMRRYSGVLEQGADGQRRTHGSEAAVARLRAILERAAATPFHEPPWPLEPLRPRISPEEYRDKVQRVLELVAAGESYQVNLSQPFGARWKADAPPGTPVRAASAYGALRRSRPASMGAVIEADPDTWFLSNSPETLLDLRWGAGQDGGGLLRSYPIKGTRPRHADPQRDAEVADELWRSPKERAEHLMIVDLVRNDLGVVAVPGTVHAEAEPRRLTLPTVHHLVTEVSATLAPGTSLRELVEAVFPGGSITGAPKRRTVEFIDEIEDHPRGIYCGAIVLLEPGGLRMSIPIRTGVLDRYGLTVCAGGGIVIDSDPEAERLETVAKTVAFGAP